MKKNLLFLCLTIAFAQPTSAKQQLPRTGDLVHKTMPLEIQQPAFPVGSLTVICGSMCSGKSEEIIRLVGRFILAGFDVLAFKPAIDNRKLLHLDQDPLTYIPSRNGSWVECIPARNSQEITNVVAHSNASIIAIDEVHFFTQESESFIELICNLIKSGKKVILAGLDLNFRGEPFGPMPALLAYADNVIKLNAICSVCGSDTYCITQRLVDGKPAHYNDPLIVVGSTQYEPRCRKCHIILKD
jgi:thymidine kinase